MRQDNAVKSAGVRPAVVLAGAGVAALLAGCAAVGPEFKPPAAPTTAGYAMTGDDANSAAGPSAAVGEAVVADWWTLFKSPQLDQIMRQAIADSPTLEEARARLAQARDAAGAEGGQLTADATAGFKRQQINLDSFSGGVFSAPAGSGISFPTNPNFNLLSLGGSVSYNLDLFGEKKRRRESLQAQTEAKARALDAAYLTLTGHVVQQALVVADARQQIEALQDVVQHDQSSLDMIRRAHDAGGASAVDVTVAEGGLAEDAAALPAQRQRLAAARHALAILVGKAPGEWAPPDFDPMAGGLPPSLPTVLPSALVHSRPDILEAEAQLHADTAEIGVAEAARYPNITLNGSYNIDALTPEAFFTPQAVSWAIGPSATAPIFHSGELKARQREAEDAARAAMAAYRRTVLEAFGQVADVLQAIAHDNQAYAEQSAALDASARRLSAVRDSYAAGGASALQLVDAERAWRRERLSVAHLGSSRYADAALLLVATASVPPGVAEGGKK